MNNIFLNINDYQNIYQISDNGIVKSCKRTLQYSDGRVILRNEKYLKPSPNTFGYLFVVLCKNGSTKSKLVHRLVAEAFIPNPNNYPEVNHIDGNKLNNCVDNLEWCTNSQNKKHAYSIGLCSRRGENHNLSKLSHADVELIRDLYNRNIKVLDIARRYNISVSHIYSIIRKVNWK